MQEGLSGFLKHVGSLTSATRLYSLQNLLKNHLQFHNLDHQYVAYDRIAHELGLNQLVIYVNEKQYFVNVYYKNKHRATFVFSN